MSTIAASTKLHQRVSAETLCLRQVQIWHISVDILDPGFNRGGNLLTNARLPQIARFHPGSDAASNCLGVEWCDRYDTPGLYDNPWPASNEHNLLDQLFEVETYLLEPEKLATPNGIEK